MQHVGTGGWIEVTGSGAVPPSARQVRLKLRAVLVAGSVPAQRHDPAREGDQAEQHNKGTGERDAALSPVERQDTAAARRPFDATQPAAEPTHEQHGGKRAEPEGEHDQQPWQSAAAARRLGGEGIDQGAGQELAGNEGWIDVFYFIVDETESVIELNVFLKALLECGGDTRLRIVAYALGTKSEEMMRGEVRQAYNLAKLGEDLRRTPAA